MRKDSETFGRRFYVSLIVAVAVSSAGCMTTYSARNPVGERFPSVRAKVLTGAEVDVPQFFETKDALLLVGFIQDSQFDVDRWLLALKQLQTPIAVAEIPAIQGLLPRLISSKINRGMKAGIPEQDWRIVFTVYSDAEKIAKFVGTTKPRNVRVLLIDKEGVVRWFHDQGFSADKAIELDRLVRERLQQNSLNLKSL